MAQRQRTQLALSQRRAESARILDAQVNIIDGTHDGLWPVLADHGLRNASGAPAQFVHAVFMECSCNPVASADARTLAGQRDRGNNAAGPWRAWATTAAMRVAASG